MIYLLGPGDYRPSGWSANAFVTGVSVIPQNQRLQPKLHLVRVPKLIKARAARTFLALFRCTCLVIHRTDFQRSKQILLLAGLCGPHFDQIHFCDDSNRSDPICTERE